MPTLQNDRPTKPRRRYWLPALSQDPDTRSIQVGLIWTVMVHLLLLLLAPQMLRSEFISGRSMQRAPKPVPYEIELAPDAFTSKPPPPMHFVETNPDANNNIPDKTNNFGAQNQQAAQPVPDKGSTLHMPKTEGDKKDFKNDSQVISGRLEKPVPSVLMPPPQQQKTGANKNPTDKKLEVPLPGFLKNQGDNPTGFGTEAMDRPEPSTGADKYVAGDRNPDSKKGAEVKAEPNSHPAPLPRPHLTQVRPALLQERPIGVANSGVIGVDAKFSEFGDYLQELINIVQIEWDKILDQGGARPKQGTHVLVTFRLNSKGEIAEIINVEEDAGDYGRNASLSAIQDRAPYRAWTKEMVAVLGESQVITFTFFYE